MATIFPSNPQINDIFEQYRYVGDGIWEIVGFNLTTEYPEVVDGFISDNVVPNTVARVSYVDTQISASVAPLLPIATASATYATINYVDNEISNLDALPAQSGNEGKFLTTTGSSAYWENVDALPAQSGNNGKFLTTDGSQASWAEVDLSEYLTSNISASVSITNQSESTSSSTGALVVSGGVGIGKDLYIDGDLHVNGTTTTQFSQTISTHDNMIYLNQAQDSTITNAVFSSGSITYTADNNYSAGMDIRITGVDPSGYNISSADGLTIAYATPTEFVVVKSDPGASYISGGTAHAKEEVNADLGFAGGYYSGGYAHAGLFRDASDGTFKFFQGYTPEPDEAVNIDTTHASFALANISAANGNFSGNVVSHVTVSTPTFSANSYTISSSNDGGLLLLDNSSTAGILYVPTDATYNFPIGTQIVLVQRGTGQITISATTPGTTTIRSTPGSKMRAQYSTANLVKIGANDWLLMGDLTA